MVTNRVWVSKRNLNILLLLTVHFTPAEPFFWNLFRPARPALQRFAGILGCGSLLRLWANLYLLFAHVLLGGFGVLCIDVG